MAAQLNNANMIKFLCQAGADVQIRTTELTTPLHWVSSSLSTWPDVLNRVAVVRRVTV